jgi:hypothetical protein
MGETNARLRKMVSRSLNVENSLLISALPLFDITPHATLMPGERKTAGVNVGLLRGNPRPTLRHIKVTRAWNYRAQPWLLAAPDSGTPE